MSWRFCLPRRVVWWMSNWCHHFCFFKSDAYSYQDLQTLTLQPMSLPGCFEKGAAMHASQSEIPSDRFAHWRFTQPWQDKHTALIEMVKADRKQFVKGPSSLTWNTLFSHNHRSGTCRYLKGGPTIGDTPIFHFHHDYGRKCRSLSLFLLPFLNLKAWWLDCLWGIESPGWSPLAKDAWHVVPPGWIGGTPKVWHRLYIMLSGGSIC